MRSIDAATVHRLLDYPALIDALAAAHRQPPPQIGRSLLQAPSQSRDSFLLLPAWAPGRAFGVKMVTVVPDNPGEPHGPPAVQALYQLFDGASGTPLASIDGTALTLRKTAADSGLGARLLARAGARTLLMVGAGALAPHLVAAHRTARPTIDRVLLWNRGAPRRAALAQHLAAAGVPATAVDELEPAARAADVVCTATMSDTPLVRGEWLRPGAHVDLVGGFTPTMREADDAVLRRGSLFVDFRGSTVGEVGDLTQPTAAGVIGARDVLADLFELCRGEHPGRRSDAEITVYKNGGGAHLDLYAAEWLLRRLRAGEHEE